MILRDFLPSPFLREYVRKHQVIRFEFGPLEVVPHKVYSPRPEICLAFYLRDPVSAIYSGQDMIQKHPRCSIIGQHTVVSDKYTGRDFWCLQIVLQQSAFFRLTGIPANELTNTFIDAEAIWGKEIRSAYEQMCNLGEDIGLVIGRAEQFIEAIARKNIKERHSLDKVSSLILYQNQAVSIDKLAYDCCLSNRQFQRKFIERSGIGPKLFDKVVRFEKAFFMKNANPHLDWLSIALACGYYDYQHLAKDYRFFTNLSPNGFYALDSKAPERTFGVVEVRQDLMV